MKNVVMICVVCLFLAACASSGRNIDFSKADQLEKGVTTKEDVRKVFGEPTRVSKYGDEESWIYNYSKTSGTANVLVRAIPIPGSSFLAPDPKTETKRLAITFDGNGKISDFSTAQSNR